MKSKTFLACGMIAPIVYIAAVVIGGVLSPGYSHISRFVSDLITSSAPHRWLLNPLFGLYNLLCIVFAAGIIAETYSDSENRKQTLGKIGARILLAEGGFGFATLFFPEGPAGSPINIVGILHIVLAGLCSLTTILSILLLGMWSRGRSDAKGWGIYSFISGAFVFASGGMAAASGASGSPIAGLVERLAIGGFLQWLFVVARVLLARRWAAQAGAGPDYRN